MLYYGLLAAFLRELRFSNNGLMWFPTSPGNFLWYRLVEVLWTMKDGTYY
jgi:hypothetical protein